MSLDPQFAATPRTDYVQIATANTNRDGTGTLGTLATGIAAGTKIENIEIMPVGTTTAGVVRLYISLDGGTTKRLLREILISAATPSGTVIQVPIILSFLNLFLPNANAVLYASTHNAETFNVFAYGGDF